MGRTTFTLCKRTKKLHLSFEIQQENLWWRQWCRCLFAFFVSFVYHFKLGELVCSPLWPVFCKIRNAVLALNEHKRIVFFFPDNQLQDFLKEAVQSLITFLIAGNLTECVQVQLTWKLSRFFDTWREAQFSSPMRVVPSLQKMKKGKKAVHSTNEDWSWKISASLCWTFRNWFILYFNFLSLRGAWTDHCFPAPFSWFLHETGLECLKITSPRCFSLKCQRKDSKKVKEHRQFRGVLGRWRTAAIYRTTCHACQRCRKTAVFAIFSRLWGVIWRGKAFGDQQC